jgi:hypothetical protein
MSSAVRLAQKVEAELGRSPLLLRSLPIAAQVDRETKPK